MTIGGRKTKILQAGGAVALAGLCLTGVATGIACPVLLGAAGTLAFSALRRGDGAACPACATSDPGRAPDHRRGGIGEIP